MAFSWYTTTWSIGTCHVVREGDAVLMPAGITERSVPGTESLFCGRWLLIVGGRTAVWCREYSAGISTRRI